jgi:hypothetical protein
MGKQLESTAAGLKDMAQGAVASASNAVSDATSSVSTSKPETATAAKEIPSLSVNDINTVGVSPTNLSLEQSLAASTSDAAKLDIALKEVEKLRRELIEARGPQVTGLRKRGNAGESVAAGTETVVEKAKEVVAGNQGVPLEVVAALVGGVFVLTYLFF